ncbi:TIGR03620 family F420-dependent LLM class oxidoreductase [Dactylosporangium sp. CA-092794]|uniref:TIGR03620 family F420-dependent LLM class oxidoreductase n=1 Tax=Dactylosporangium sp. CA-092794 TaxID=3239929 RepID=UPI003D933416
MRSTGIGLWTASLDGTAVAELPGLVADLDAQGWASLWFGEAYGREATTTAAILLSASSRLRVGTGIANIYGRDAIACAAAARTLHALHPGRFTLGLGVSHAPLVERMRGHRYGRPLREMGAYLDAMLAAPSVVPGEQELPPIVLAALGPRMIELARDRTQGALPYLGLPEHTAQARTLLGDEPTLIVEQAAVVTPGIGEEEWRRRAHVHLELYTGLPNYRASLTRQGFSDDDLVRGGSDALKRAMVPFGLDATLSRIDEHLAAGANEVLVQVLGPQMLTPPRSDWALMAEALR